LLGKGTNVVDLPGDANIVSGSPIGPALAYEVYDTV
jgi:hypothetical protein